MPFVSDYWAPPFPIVLRAAEARYRVRDARNAYEQNRVSDIELIDNR